MIKSRITLKQLEAFVFVVDTGTFRGAATALGTTQPNISARISALEATLGTSLLNREAGSAKLTAKGHLLLEKTRAILWAGEALLEEAERKDLIEEKLRLGVTELVACSWLRDFLRRLKENYPSLRVELEVDISTVIDRRLSEGELDLAFQTEPVKGGPFTNVPLGLEAYCWVAHPSLARTLGTSPSLAAFFQQTILTHAKHTEAGRALHEIATARGFDSGQIVHSSALSACIPMVQERLGVALLPKALVHEEIRVGSLRRIESDWVPDPLSFVARYPADRTARFVAKAASFAAEAMRTAQRSAIT